MKFCCGADDSLLKIKIVINWKIYIFTHLYVLVFHAFDKDRSIQELSFHEGLWQHIKETMPNHLPQHLTGQPLTVRMPVVVG